MIDLNGIEVTQYTGLHPWHRINCEINLSMVHTSRMLKDWYFIHSPVMVEVFCVAVFWVVLCCSVV